MIAEDPGQRQAERNDTAGETARRRVGLSVDGRARSIPEAAKKQVVKERKDWSASAREQGGGRVTVVHNRRRCGIWTAGCRKEQMESWRFALPLQGAGV